MHVTKRESTSLRGKEASETAKALVLVAKKKGGRG